MGVLYSFRDNTYELCIFPMYFRNHFIETQMKSECNLLLSNNKGSAGLSWAPMTELNKTFDKILIRPHKTWYLGNIKCDLTFFYIILTLMSLGLNKIISLNVCALMMCLSCSRAYNPFISISGKDY